MKMHFYCAENFVSLYFFSGRIFCLRKLREFSQSENSVAGHGPAMLALGFAVLRGSVALRKTRVVIVRGVGKNLRK